MGDVSFLDVLWERIICSHEKFVLLFEVFVVFVEPITNYAVEIFLTLMSKNRINLPRSPMNLLSGNDFRSSLFPIPQNQIEIRRSRHRQKIWGFFHLFVFFFTEQQRDVLIGFNIATGEGFLLLLLVYQVDYFDNGWFGLEGIGEESIVVGNGHCNDFLGLAKSLSYLHILFAFLTFIWNLNDIMPCRINNCLLIIK